MTYNYEYTVNDLLNNPQKYQMTKFEGADFLLAYKNQRNEIIKILNLQKISTLEEIMNEFASLDSLENLYKKLFNITLKITFYFNFSIFHPPKQ